ncbi:MAG: response regulator [Spirochaetes bacterium]|jgi:two-component system chemotaxis response regulator CheY|nr:response regulator [Spirochaetota bacterium]
MANIMIVDDSKFMRSIIKDTLLETNHTIIAETDNGVDALTLYNDLNPDLVTMDITIHGRDGIQTIEDIKKSNPDAKIVIVSALSKTTLQNSSKNLSVSAFVTKPFKKEDLQKAINDAL